MGKKTYIGALVTAEEKDLLLRAARQMDVTLSEFIKRRLFLMPEVTPREKEEDHPSEMLTISQMAAYLHVSPRKARTLVEEGRVLSVRIGKLYRVTKASLDEYLSRERDRTKELPDLLRPEEAASFLKISRSTMHRMIVSGEITSFRVANRYRLRREDVMAKMGGA